jgi:transposase
MEHSQKPKALERRHGEKLLAAGKSHAEVARQVGVSRPTVTRWRYARQDGNMEALRRAPHCGRPELLSVAQRKELLLFLKGAAGGRFSHGVVDIVADRATDRGEVRGEYGIGCGHTAPSSCARTSTPSTATS